VQTNCSLWALFADCFAKFPGQPTDFKSATCGPGPSLLLALSLELFYARRLKPSDRINLCEDLTLPIPVAVQSKASVCGCSLSGIPCSNPAEGMDVCLL
jgi:hypothetical protein